MKSHFIVVLALLACTSYSSAQLTHPPLHTPLPTMAGPEDDSRDEYSDREPDEEDENLLSALHKLGIGNYDFEQTFDGDSDLSETILERLHHYETAPYLHNLTVLAKRFSPVLTKKAFWMVDEAGYQIEKFRVNQAGSLYRDYWKHIHNRAQQLLATRWLILAFEQKALHDAKRPPEFWRPLIAAGYSLLRSQLIDVDYQIKVLNRFDPEQAGFLADNIVESLTVQSGSRPTDSFESMFAGLDSQLTLNILAEKHFSKVAAQWHAKATKVFIGLTGVTIGILSYVAKNYFFPTFHLPQIFWYGVGAAQAVVFGYFSGDYDGQISQKIREFSSDIDDMGTEMHRIVIEEERANDDLSLRQGQLSNSINSAFGRLGITCQKIFFE